ncbi:MAG: adenosylmethionine--8-amino-7-oxononanoate transaminase [Victivallales bacterium]
MNKLQKRDLKHVWHPCSQMKDYEAFPPLPVKEARGAYIITADGRKVIDGISSWWCKSLGHSHPRIRKAVQAQIAKFEHVIMANTCNETLVALSERLCALMPGLDKVFYADNGSTAVEIAMKMSLQYHAQSGAPERTKFLSLKNGYHGETILTLSASDCGIYSSPYKSLMISIPKIAGVPYLSGQDSPEWLRMEELQWKKTEKMLDRCSGKISAIIFEPIVQGAGGMLVYSPDFLKKLRRWATVNSVHLIADEIMTGFGRTGRMLACEHAGIVPDLLCLSKGLTAGWGPMSAILCSRRVYKAFYDDYGKGKSFLHSNTYSGHAISAAAALEAMKIYEDEGIIAKVAERGCELRRRMEWVASETGALADIRGVGYVVAGNIVSPHTGKPFSPSKRIGFEFYRNAVKYGALLRPLGDTIYFLPPLNTSGKVLDDLAEIAVRALKKAVWK